MSKVWLITGCSTGFGKVFVQELVAKGEKVVATARNLETIKHFQEAAPDQVLAAALDIQNRDQVNEVVRAAVEKFGRIDRVVNNAGIGIEGMFEEFSEEQIRKMFDVNVFGTINVIQATLPVLRQQQSGHYINISSVLGVLSTPTYSIYSGTKFALAGISEGLVNEVQPFGIKVTLVEPSYFATDFAGKTEFTKEMPEYAGVHDFMKKEKASWPVGDPVKGVRAILTAVESENPPLHFPIGITGTYGSQQTLENRLQEVKAWQSLALEAAQ